MVWQYSKIIPQFSNASGTAQLVAFWLHGLSKTSQPCYESDIRHFVAFLLNENPDMVPLNDIRHLVKNNVETRNFASLQGL